VFAWTMGITHHLHGAATVQAIAALALMRRMVGRPGAGLQPIRGHSNIQGMGTVGVTPTLKQAIFDRLQRFYGVTLPTMKGYDTLECLDAADRGEMRFAVCLGGNLYGSSPDATYARRSMGKIDTVVYLSTSLNTGHAWGTGGEETIILPVLARDEEPEPSTQESMFSYIRLSDGGTPRHVGPRAEVEIIADLATRVVGEGGPVNWRDMSHTSTIRNAIAAIVPGLEQIAEIDTRAGGAHPDDDPQRGAVQHRRLRGGRPLPQPDAAGHRAHSPRRRAHVRPHRRGALPDCEHGWGDAGPDRVGVRPNSAGLCGDVLPREQRARAQGGRSALTDTGLQERGGDDRSRRRDRVAAETRARTRRRRHPP